MEIRFGDSTCESGPGVLINLDADELATAIEAYLVAHGVLVAGPRTMRVNGEKCQSASVFVDPIGHVCKDGSKWDGWGEFTE